MKILVTGGAGFVGSALIRHILNCTDRRVIYKISVLEDTAFYNG